MKEECSSFTALGAARSRAAHRLLDDEPKIFQDHLALGLCGINNEAILRADIEALISKAAIRLGSELAQKMFSYPRAMMAMRSRYTEEALEQTINSGMKQYVILGAGLASFAYRRLDLVDRLQVFEVDHPSTQQWKQGRLRELNLECPPNLTFIPLDFEKQTLLQGLRRGGYRPEEPAYFSWLGGTQYLSEEAVFSMLNQVASTAAKTVLTFTYIASKSQLDEENQRLLAITQFGARAHGEPWLSFFESSQLGLRLRDLGFTQIFDLSPEEANARYFADREDGLCVPSLEHVMQVQVGRVY
ncbi:SAM-dependent methyltransferase [Candidatus Entotheonella serta]|nr:SAM-dependent methyltransferase [Candidatus Entotheonella serta]